MTTIPIPTPVRVVAYLLGLLVGAVGTPLTTYLTAEGRIDTATAIFLAAIFAAIALVAAVLALSHLSLPDTVSDTVADTKAPARKTTTSKGA